LAQPFQPHKKTQLSFSQLTDELRQLFSQFTDKRTGNNTIYTIEDIAMGAFAVFFTQSPSFLAHQTADNELDIHSLENNESSMNLTAIF
jgi:hypothetical protein